MQTDKILSALLQLLLSVVLIAHWSVARSAVVEDLYTATVERRTDVSDTRAAALADAITQVVVRVTGSRMAAFAPELEQLRNNPARFVASFGYPSATEALVSFLPREIERELTAAGWPVWGAERPLSVIWIAVTDQFGDQAVLEADNARVDAVYTDHMSELLDALRADIERVAQLRGIPYVLPEFATQEEMLLGFAQAWGYSFAGLDTLSAPYAANAVVIGRVRESVIGTDVEWLLQTETLRMSYPGATLTDGIDWIADAFAQEYGSTGERRPVTLRVSGVRDFDTYARVLAYLESVTMLSDVNVESFAGGELMVRASSRGDSGVLSRTLALDDVLRERAPSIGNSRGFGNVLNLLVVPERTDALSANPPR